jgi:hypothetical protein
MEPPTVFNTLQLRTHGVHHGVKTDMLDLVLNLEQVSVVSTHQPPSPPLTDFSLIICFHLNKLLVTQMNFKNFFKIPQKN